jgi:hypothetical protein
MLFVHPPPIKGFRLTRLLLRTAGILLLVGGCRSARAAANVDPQTRSLFCERSHTNHARSYQHRGIYVDAAGSIFRFRHARGDQHLLRVPADSVTEQALLARFAPGRRQIGTVTPAEMEQRHAQAVEARDGAFSERRRRGADMGATVRRCWLPDAAGVYRDVLLRQTGDWELENRSPAATELSRWLDSLSMLTAR